MKLLVDKNTKVIVNISEQAIVRDEGIDVGGTIFVMKDQLDIVDVTEIPSYVKPQKYKYVDGQFILNPDYSPYRDQYDQRITELELLVASLIGGGGM